jgi:hypothetical protein
MSEPPKPITKLAQPIDRTGPRGDNPLAPMGLILAVLACVCAGALVLAGHSSWGMGFFVSAVASGVAGFILSLAALRRAVRRHLRLGGAICGLVLCCLLGGAALAWLARQIFA